MLDRALPSRVTLDQTLPGRVTLDWVLPSHVTLDPQPQYRAGTRLPA